MAKISPVSIKYMIRARFTAEGALEKPDVIGALFGQTEGLLGSELEMRELQKEGKIGRIEVELERENSKTTGVIEIPTALDQSETTLIAAAIETIERIGPTDARIEVEKIEDVRGKKRDFIVERAKELMKSLDNTGISKEISEDVKSSTRASKIQEYGDEKLPCGDISGEELIVVEGRADVINLLRNGVNNVIGMNGTKLPRAIGQLSREKEIILFVDGDRGGKLIAQNVMDNANVAFIAVAPDGKEVEELPGKEILIALRKKVPASSFFFSENQDRNYDRDRGYQRRDYRQEREPERTEQRVEQPKIAKREITSEEKLVIKRIAEGLAGTKKAVILNQNLEIIREVSEKGASISLRKANQPFALILDGIATNNVIRTAEESGVQVLMAKNFSSTSENLTMMSF